MPNLTIRAAQPSDAAALEVLALSAGRAPIAGRSLLATVRGVPVAAVGVTSGAVIVDPSSAPVGAVARLRLRRYQLLRQGGHAGPAWALLR